MPYIPVLGGDSVQYMGVSTETKPTQATLYSLLMELDTGKMFYWNGTQWSPVGG